MWIDLAQLPPAPVPCCKTAWRELGMAPKREHLSHRHGCAAIPHRNAKSAVVILQTRFLDLSGRGGA